MRGKKIGNAVFYRKFTFHLQKGKARQYAIYMQRFQWEPLQPPEGKIMKFNTKPVRALAAMALSASLIAAASASAWAADTGPTAEQKQQWVQKHQERMKARLAKAAQTLGISTSQQAAWDAYTAAVLAAFPTPGTGKPDGDAASIARMRAERSAAHAQKMAALADATATLQALLTPEQRKTFDQLVQRAGHRGHHGHRMHGATQADKK